MKKSIISIISLLFLASVSSMLHAGSYSNAKSGHLSHFIRKFDRNNDGQVTKNEFTLSIEQRYTVMDANNDGQVDKDEFKEYNQTKHQAYRKKKNKKMDADGDGLISKQEYLDEKIKRIEQKFAKMDKNADGYLSEDEYVRKKSRFKKAGHYFKKLDKNADGMITPEESLESSEKMFMRLDQNNDQIITQDEIQLMHHQRHNK